MNLYLLAFLFIFINSPALYAGKSCVNIATQARMAEIKRERDERLEKYWKRHEIKEVKKRFPKLSRKYWNLREKVRKWLQRKGRNPIPVLHIDSEAYFVMKAVMDKTLRFKEPEVYQDAWNKVLSWVEKYIAYPERITKAFDKAYEALMQAESVKPYLNDPNPPKWIELPFLDPTTEGARVVEVDGVKLYYKKVFFATREKMAHFFNEKKNTYDISLTLINSQQLFSEMLIHMEENTIINL